VYTATRTGEAAASKHTLMLWLTHHHGHVRKVLPALDNHTGRDCQFQLLP